MPPPTRKPAELPQALASHKLLVDTCFLMDQNFPTFLQDFTAASAPSRVQDRDEYITSGHENSRESHKQKKLVCERGGQVAW